MSIDNNKRRPWEDTLIIALRDLQWSKSKSPPVGMGLFKFDGQAETALGDMKFQAGSKYFLLEAKANAKAISEESDKPLFELMKMLLDGKIKAQEELDNLDPELPLKVANFLRVDLEEKIKSFDYFREISEIGHCFIISHPTGQANQTINSVEHISIYVGAIPYLGYVEEFQANNDYCPDVIADFSLMAYPDSPVPLAAGAGDSETTQESERNSPGISSQLGLDENQMAAYISFLIDAHQSFNEGAKGKGLPHPLKCIVWSPNGFFWPLANLLNPEHVRAILNSEEKAYDIIVEKLSAAREYIKSNMVVVGSSVRKLKEDKENEEKKELLSKAKESLIKSGEFVPVANPTKVKIKPPKL